MKKFYGRVLLVSFLIIGVHFSSLPAFQSMQDLQYYSEQMEEFPDADNENWLMPDYTTFIKNSRPGFFSRLLYKLHIKKEVWTPKIFEAQIKKLIHDRELNSYKGDFLLKSDPEVGSKFIVWGDVQGAFHSFVRDLGALKKFGVIDDSLKIIKPNHYFIVTGDFISRSPYSMELLSALFALMLKNPKEVVYIKGNHETKDKWYNFGLKTELIEKGCDYSKEKVPYLGLVNRFFNTLPLAVYVKGYSFDGDEFLRLSHFDRNFEKLNETHFAKFLHKKNVNGLDVFNLNDKELSGGTINIKAIIKAESRSMVYQATDGLKLLVPDYGATAWSLLSTPTRTYRTLFDFQNDAFAVLSVNSKNMRSWTLSLYNRDVRTDFDFGETIYNLVTGDKIFESPRVNLLDIYEEQEGTYKEELKKLKRRIVKLKKEVKSTREFKKDKKQISAKEVLARYNKKEEERLVAKEREIVIGCTTDLTRKRSYLSAGILQGMLLYIDKVNKTGGINGKKIRLIVLDDEYNSNKTPKLVDLLGSDHNTNILLSSGGSPTNIALLPKIKAGTVLNLFPNSGSSHLRTQDLQYIINFRPAYRNEAMGLVDYAVNSLGLKKLAFVFADEKYRTNGVSGARRKLKALGITDWCEVGFKKDNLDVDFAIKKIKEFGPQVIIFFAADMQMKLLVEKIGVDYLSGKTLMGISTLDELRTALRRKGLEMTMSKVVPSYENNYLEMVRDYNQDREKELFDASEIALEGYINANIFVRALKNISGSITKESIVAELTKTKDILFKGLTLNFNEVDRTLSSDVWIDDGKGWPVHRRIEAHTFVHKEQVTPSL